MRDLSRIKQITTAGVTFRVSHCDNSLALPPPVLGNESLSLHQFLVTEASILGGLEVATPHMFDRGSWGVVDGS